jgi:hypothetical protein
MPSVCLPGTNRESLRRKNRETCKIEIAGYVFSPVFHDVRKKKIVATARMVAVVGEEKQVPYR